MSLSGNLGETGEVKFSVHLLTLSGKSKSVDAILDTGGSYSLISASLATSLGLEKRRNAELASAKHVSMEPVYYVFVKIDNLFDELVPFVECKTVAADFVTIGRPILKKWDIDYRGIKQSFEIRKPDESTDTN